MKAQILLIAALFLFASSTLANDKNDVKEKVSAANAITSISGTITDEVSGESLVGVKIVLEGTDKVAYTDFDGMFKFEGISNGVYTMSVDYVSYKDKAQSIDTKKTSDVAIKLKASL
ncbi:carboxypeptidase-like regulatory domain-containing protein [Carboxylicivirga sp. N1Y90]|uniref:carboxypeptidase-like regulatory domain-containing protein n=1 Tax=Carboxylicivirga fragile TaxID=3417571 RepID=UPI003D359669|nr:carboxypeptidase-like regulatory domain-containing protein [Marinilabiliaceae bacterium N1Y90]